MNSRLQLDLVGGKTYDKKIQREFFSNWTDDRIDEKVHFLKFIPYVLYFHSKTTQMTPNKVENMKVPIK